MLPFALIVAGLYISHIVALWRPPTPASLAKGLAGAAVAAHLIFASLTLFQAGSLHLGVLTILSALFALTLAGRLWFLKLPFPKWIDAALAFMALILVLLQGFLPNSPPFRHVSSWAFNLHIFIAVLAYVVLALAALLSTAIWVADRRLHQKPSSRLVQSLPPLLTLEKRLFALLWSGFVLLSITLLTGVAFSEQLFGRAAPLTHKTIFSIIAWLVFATLLTGRARYGWRGRTAITWTLAGFGLLVLAYIGSKFVLEIVLHRGLA